MSRKRHREHANHERWLVSYADFITLLFAFFVVLYSSSQMDKTKMARMAAAIEGAFQLGVFQGSKPGPPEDPRPSGATAEQKVNSITPPKLLESVTIAAPENISSASMDEPTMRALKQRLEAVLAKELKERKIILRPGPEGLIISLSEYGFFDSGSAEMKKEAEPQFARIAHLVMDQHFDVRIEGHTDNIPIHSTQFASNWDLSTARAVNLAKIVIDNYGCPPERLAVAGYGEYHPVASNDTPEGRQQNRRVDLVILAPKVQPATGGHTK